MHRREARIAAALPASVPTPRFLGSYDDGQWVALWFDDVDGRAPAIPWRRDELDRVLAGVTELTTRLTPAPIAVQPVHEVNPDAFHGWQQLNADALSGEDDVPYLDPWVREHLDQLVDLESSAPAAAAGQTLLHCDLRADNVLLTPSKAFFVDWPWASLGAAWVDLLFMLPSVAMQRGPKPWEIFDTHPLGRSARAQDATAVLAAICGFFIRYSRLPPPPGLPTLRAFQRNQGVYALEWLKRTTDWR